MTTNVTEASIENIIKHLEAGNQFLKFNSRHKDVILLLGNTGSGKSTVTQFLIGDNSKLFAVETKFNPIDENNINGYSSTPIPTELNSDEYSDEMAYPDETEQNEKLNHHTGQYTIIDLNNKISNNETIVSKTTFPEVFWNDNSTIYDCPGFSDTRSEAHDIATNYLIKKIIDNTERVKIVFIVPQSSVVNGGDRTDFPELLKHATNTLKNLNILNRSIGLIVTKVENRRIGETEELVSDEVIINTVATFLNETKKLLKDNEQSTNLLDILLMKVKNKYRRIAIFRNPNKSGPVSDIPICKMVNQLFYGFLTI